MLQKNCKMFSHLFVLNKFQQRQCWCRRLHNVQQITYFSSHCLNNTQMWLNTLPYIVFMLFVFWRVPRPALFLKVKNASCLFLKVKNAPCRFLKVKIAPCSFLEVKNAPCLISERKSKPYPFPFISRARKLDSYRKSKNAIWKVCVRKNSCTQKTADFESKRHFVSTWRNI